MNDNPSASMSRFARLLAIYKGLALILMNIVVAFIAINVFCWAAFSLKDGLMKNAKTGVELEYDIERLRKVYPNYSDSEIRNLLTETWSRKYQIEPFTLFKERPFQGAYVNVREAGFRENDRQAVWPPEQESINVFIFGGSTTFGYGVADAETIPAQLEAYLSGKTNARVRVYNFGNGSYASTQERIRFEQLLLAGFVPDVAVFIDGINDFVFFDGIPHGLDRMLHASEHRVDAAAAVLLSRLPVSRAALGVHRRLGGSEVERDEAVDVDDRRVIMEVIERYKKNIEITQALGNSQDISTVFVWQPIPMYHYDDKQYHLFRRGSYGQAERAGHGFREMEALADQLRARHRFLWLADLQQERKEPLYVDGPHYTAKFSTVIAEAIGDELLGRGILKKRGEAGGK